MEFYQKWVFYPYEKIKYENLEALGIDLSNLIKFQVPFLLTESF